MALKNIKFCWHCGKRFWGNTFVVMFLDGYERKLHKCCKKTIKEDAATDKLFGYERGNDE